MDGLDTRDEFDIQTLVMLFVKHYSTHSLVYEVHETLHLSESQVPHAQREMFFTGNDGTVYMILGMPSLMTREKADAYCVARETEYYRYEVIDLT